MRAMTAPSSRQAPRYTSTPDPRRKAELTVARREDVRRLAEFGPPAEELPPVHGRRGDPRYPGPTSLRHLLAFLIDLVLHLGIAAAVAVALAMRQDIQTGVLGGIGAFFGSSILDRIVVQRIFHATAGKMITGLRVIRDDDGGPPTLWLLVKEWFLGIFFAVSMLNV